MAYLHFVNPSDGIIKHYPRNEQDHRCSWIIDREDTTSHRVSKEMQGVGAIGFFPSTPTQLVAGDPWRNGVR